jgi:hypothetical protein
MINDQIIKFDYHLNLLKNKIINKKIYSIQYIQEQS